MVWSEREKDSRKSDVPNNGVFTHCVFKALNTEIKCVLTLNMPIYLWEWYNKFTVD